ncbi:MAG: 2-oxo acid dehydrogenase subunit E2 [Candidatus Tyrphobacter sp.]
MATIDLRIPDIGNFKDVPVIEVLVKPGQRVKKDDSLITLESEKASMEIPSAQEGTIADLRVKVGDKVSTGSVIATIESADGAAQPPPPQQQHNASRPVTSSVANAVSGVEGPSVANAVSGVEGPPSAASRVEEPPGAVSGVEGSSVAQSGAVIHASPSIRRLAREFGVELPGVKGSGPHGRITRDDLQGFVKGALADGRGGIGIDIPPWPSPDFARYGPVERRPLTRIKRVAGPNLHRNWLRIPHITNYDEADVTGLEKFRRKINEEQEKKKGPKLTMLAFLVKACIAALREFPEFNASLDGDSLVYKRYYNIGFAADTKDGLVVPVIKNADGKGLIEIAAEAAQLAGKARDGRLSTGEMSGGSFTISSIGGIGGTQFTQIVNAPEVAILGATRAAMKPVWTKKHFAPRLILPISVSYDHRVIDGAAAARFLVYVAGALSDFRRVML